MNLLDKVLSDIDKVQKLNIRDVSKEAAIKAIKSSYIDLLYDLIVEMEDKKDVIFDDIFNHFLYSKQITQKKDEQNLIEPIKKPRVSPGDKKELIFQIIKYMKDMGSIEDLTGNIPYLSKSSTVSDDFNIERNYIGYTLTRMREVGFIKSLSRKGYYIHIDSPLNNDGSLIDDKEIKELIDNYVTVKSEKGRSRDEIDKTMDKILNILEIGGSKQKEPDTIPYCMTTTKMANQLKTKPEDLYYPLQLLRENNLVDSIHGKGYYIPYVI